jgi:preprotein translocase subunit SecG
MEAVLLVIHLIIALAIIGVILLQPSESGGFMGNSGSMSNLGAQRRSSDLLTRTTAILVACFFGTSLLLAISAGNHGKPASILEAVPAAAFKVETKTEGEAEKPAKPEKPATPKAPISQ